MIVPNESELTMQQNNNTDQIGSTIHYYRLIRKMTQEQLGESAECSPGFIGQIERGECMPSVHILGNIIQALDIDANELFWNTKDTPAEDQQLTNQILQHVNRLSMKEKKFILSMINHLNILD